MFKIIVKYTRLILWPLYGLSIAFFYVKYNYIRQSSDWIQIILIIAIVITVYYVYRFMMSAGVLKATRSYPVALYGIGFIFFMLFIGTASLLLAFSDAAYWQSVIVLTLNAAKIAALYLFFLCLWYVSGRALYSLLRLNVQNPLGRFILALVLGMGLCILYFYVGALLRVISTAWLIAYVVICLIFVGKSITSLAALIRKKTAVYISVSASDSRTGVFLLIIAAFVYSAFVMVSSSTMRPIDPDSVKTYAYIPYTIIQSGGIVYFPHLPLNNAPLASSYLYIPFMMFGPQYILYLNTVLVLLVIGTIYYAGKKYFDKRTAILASLLFLSMNFIFMLAATVKSDYLLMLFILWAALCLLRYMETERMRWLIASGIVFGFAAAIKFNALAIAPGFALVLLLHGRRPLYRTIVDLASFGTAALLSFAPWAIRGMLQYGSLFYPYSLLGMYGNLTAEAAGLMRSFGSELSSYTHILHKSNPFIQNLFFFAVNNTNYAYNKVGPLFAGLLPLVLLVRMPAISKKILLMSIPPIIFWLWLFPSQFWYILYVLPLLWLPIAVAVSRARVRVLSGVVSAIIAFLLIANVRTHQLHYVQTLFAGDYDTLIASDPERVENYINNTVAFSNPRYLILPFGKIDTFTIEDHYAHVINNDFMIYWMPLMADNQYDFNRIREVLRSRGVTHVYYNRRFMAALENPPCSDAVPCPTVRRVGVDARKFVETLSLVREADGWMLYSVE